MESSHQITRSNLAKNTITKLSRSNKTRTKTLENGFEKDQDQENVPKSLKRQFKEIAPDSIQEEESKQDFGSDTNQEEKLEQTSIKMIFSYDFQPLVNYQQELQLIRNSLFEIGGFNFPFEYNPNNGKFEMIMKPYQKVLLTDPTKSIKKIFLEVGKYCFHNHNVLCCIKKIQKDTSQGVVYVLEHRDAKIAIHNDNISDTHKNQKIKRKGTFIVLKTDKICKENNIWHDPEKQDNVLIFGENNANKYKLIGAGYMDAFCCQFLSNIVEEEKLPHFPLVYGTTINQFGKDFFQMLWMEYLPYSLFDVLNKESDIRVWSSCLFQLAFTLAYVQINFGFNHNDFHADNIRIRTINKNESANYIVKLASSNENIIELNVPYYGILCCIIDCGRSLIKPWGLQKIGLISSEFSNDGNCEGLIPDNHSFDMVRLLSCLHSMSSVIKPEKDRLKFQDFISQFCITDDKKNYLDGFERFTTPEFKKLKEKQRKIETYEYIEKYPRINCHGATPLRILKSMTKIFKPSSLSTKSFILEI